MNNKTKSLNITAQFDEQTSNAKQQMAQHGNMIKHQQRSCAVTDFLMQYKGICVD